MFHVAGNAELAGLPGFFFAFFYFWGTRKPLDLAALMIYQTVYLASTGP